MTVLSALDGDLAAALQRFRLDGYRPLRGVAGPPATIEALDQASGALVVLKEKRPYLSDDEFRMHVALHHHSYRVGGPVATPLIQRGAVALEGATGELAELQTFIAGRAPDPADAAELSHISAALSQFHASVAGFSRTAQHAEPRDRFGKAAFYCHLLEATSVPQHLVTALRHRLSRAKALLPVQGAHEGPLYHRQMLHGDPAASNFIIGEDGRAFIVDLDDAHMGLPLEDVAWLTCMTAGFRWRQGQVPSHSVQGSWDHTRLRAVTAGYVTGLDAPEPTMDQLLPWLCASVVCAVVDCCLEKSEPLVPVEELASICEAATALIDEALEI